eukprot:8475674-Ditylum_brightwellii.AAC.1
MECFKAYAFLTDIYKNCPYGLDEFGCPLAFIKFLWFGKRTAVCGLYYAPLLCNSAFHEIVPSQVMLSLYGVAELRTSYISLGGRRLGILHHWAA